jgi:ATP-binding protein involved in chromosome partitioning
MEIRVASDAGRPPAAGNGPEGAAFGDIAGKIDAWLKEPRHAAQR